ncbi:uroporphyrinogen decarboxylase family protein [Dysgonomonas sp. UBA7698]|uniref:uroporphyrinogen decarboxylase family protein n=1 Tax=Dysgonomonas sp. UBA7698 TaxID=1946427 RepID=UPI0025C43777|nr:uroporphyrinogen decarboxylase family protein [Dysgonomonas sp. UBA7698]
MNSKLEKIHSYLQTPKTGDGRRFFHPILMMYAARQFGKTYTDFMTDYRVLVEANMKCLEMHDFDAVSVISDPYREASAFGAKITFDGDSSPKADILIRTMEDVDNLKNPDVYACERTLDRINGVKYFRELLGDKFPVIAWVEGPLAEVADLSGVSETMMNMIVEPDMVKKLQRKCLQTAKDFAVAQIDAGANIVGVGDALCSQISLEMYDEFCLPLHQELFEFIHSKGALVKVHICGNITHILPSLAKTNLDILDIDWMVDMAEAYRVMGPEIILAGNLDPVAAILDATKEQIEAKYREIEHSIPRENWIVMGGCEIPPATPVENMDWLRELSIK